METNPQVNWGAIIAAGLVAWRLFVRIRRNVGPQPLRPVRLLVRIAIYLVLAVVVGYLAYVRHPEHAVPEGLLLGLILGAILGAVGLKLTKYENTPDGLFYKPNPVFGVGLSVLLLCRVSYHFLFFRAMRDSASAHGLPSQSRLTQLAFGLLAGYYLIYFSGLYLRRNQT